ncbi:MAG: VWA domain-containing protein [Saprospiraceae bacterium]
MTDYFSHITFEYPLVLMSIPLIIGLAWFVHKKSIQQKNYILLPKIGKGNQVTTFKSKVYPYLPLLGWFALLLMIVGVARPRIPLTEDKVTSEGIDIMMVMDLSSSMLAKDFLPNRLDACKKLAIDFVDKRYNDRIGIIIFAGEAYTLCPLTTDHAVVKDLLSQIQIGILEDKTAIGMGLGTAVKRLKDIESASKIIILLTDGENNAGYIDPMTATELAKKYQVKIYTIAVGTTGIAMMPSNIFGRGNDIPVQVSIDTKLLTTIAEETNGKFYRATDNESLENIYKEIDSLEKSEIEQQVFKRYTDVYPFFVKISIVLMLLYYVLTYTVFKRLM